MPGDPLTVVFCIPGAIFSGRFLQCWTDLFAKCVSNRIRPLLSNCKSCNIYYVRNMCLGGDVSRGKEQRPFNGMLEYDYVMWIDSDMVFTPENFFSLLRHDHDVVSGIYPMEGGEQVATVERWDEEYFIGNGTFEFLRQQEIDENRGLFPVAYTGMGFMLVKKGVFEKLDYPWFKPIEKTIGKMTDFTMEDVAFCLRARDAGFEILIDPKVRIGHEKSVIL